MKRILIGNLDPVFQKSLCEAFEQQREEYGVSQIKDPSHLKEQLETDKGDLLLLDMDQAPEQGFDYLSIMARQRSTLPILAIGTKESPDVQTFDAIYPDLYFPLVKYLKKPVGIEKILEEAQNELRHSTWGVIQGLSIPSLLQMLKMEQKTCTIRVTSGRRQGFFYMREGQVINARYRRQEGFEAFRHLVYAPSPKMEIDSQLHDATQCIELRLEELLMQAAQFQDECATECTFPMEEAHDPLPPSEIGKWDHKAAPASTPTPEAPQASAQKASSPKRSGKLWFAGIAATLALAAVGYAMMPRKPEAPMPQPYVAPVHTETKPAPIPEAEPTPQPTNQEAQPEDTAPSETPAETAPAIEAAPPKRLTGGKAQKSAKNAKGKPPSPKPADPGVPSKPQPDIFDQIRKQAD